MPNYTDPISEILKHLRTIHFLIVLASLLTLMSIFSGSSGEVGLASDQLERITTIVSSWETWTKRFSLEQTDWLKSLGIKWIEDGREPVFIRTKELKDLGLIPASESSIWRLQLEGFPIYFYLSTKPRNGQSQRLVFAMPYGRGNQRDTLPLEISFPGSAGSHPFKTIKQFRDFWNSAHQPMAWFASELAPEAYFFLGSNLKATLSLEKKTSQGSTLDLNNSSLGGCQNELFRVVLQRLRKNSYDSLLCREIHNGSLVIQVKSREPRIPADLQQWLIKEFDLSGPAGTFSYSFPELDRVTQNYQELTIDKAHAILDAELKRGGERIEFLGMKLPETLMATWGGIVILILQVYFWLHLRALSNRGTQEQISNFVAWIGAYPDIFARVTTIITILFLPIGTTICAVMIADISKIIAIVLPLISSSFSGYSAYRLWSLSGVRAGSGV